MSEHLSLAAAQSRGSEADGEQAAGRIEAGTDDGVLGLRVRLHWSWFIIVGLLTWGLASDYYPSASPGWSKAADWISALATSALFFSSLLLHEMAHSLVARHLGLPVRRITLFAFGGVSELGDEPSAPSQEFWMTVAGPATSFALAALFFAIWFIAAGLGLRAIRPAAGYLAGINLAVGLFNLLPGFPLDGGRILRSIIWRSLRNQLEATRIASMVGRVVAALLAGAGVLFLFTGNVINGVWFLMIAWFLDSAASSSYGQLRVQLALHDVAIAPLLQSDTPLISPDASLREFAEEVILGRNQRAGFVGRDTGSVEGLISIRDLRRVPSQRWGSTTVAETMTPIARLAVVNPNTSAEDALKLMDARSVNQLPLLAMGEAPRLLTRAALIQALNNRLELASRKTRAIAAEQ